MSSSWRALSEANAHAQAWFASRLDLTPANRANQASGLGHYLGFCRRVGVDLERAKPDLIETYVLELTGRALQHGALPRHRQTVVGLANSTVQQRLSTVRLFYDYLVKEGVLARNPVRRSGRGRGDRGSRGVRRGLVPVQNDLPWVLNEAEWSRVVDAFRTEPLRNQLMLALAYDCALRRREMLSLQASDVDRSEATITVRFRIRSTDRLRVVPISPETDRLLGAYQIERSLLSTSDGPLLLSGPSHRYAVPLSREAWSTVLIRARVRADVPRLTTDSFRHLRLTKLAGAGLDVHHLAEFAGFGSLRTAMLYVHLSGREFADTIDVSLTALQCFAEADDPCTT